MYKAKVNQSTDLNIIFSEEQYHVNDQAIDWDIINLGNDRFHILYKSVSYQVELIECNLEEKSFLFYNGFTLFFIGYFIYRMIKIIRD